MYSITLQNAAGDNVISSGDILGRINFAVPSESDGAAATYIASQIYCEADGSFTSGSNPAGLIFSTSSSDSAPASGRLKISSDGHVIPLASGAYDLGSSFLPFRNLYVDGGYVTAPTGVFDVISFNVDNESILTKGQLSWDDTEGSLSIGLTDNTTIHIGEHRYFRIRNETGGILYKGQVVYANGVHSNGLIAPNLYVADGTVREVRFMGVILEHVNNNNNGYVVDFGHLHDMDLDGSASNYAVGDETWAAGDILYVHPTVAGKLTKVEPKHSISVAIVLDPGNGNGNGRMFVRPTSYGHLDDNHDVSVSGATNGQFLQYNSTTDYWVPSSSGNFTTLQVNGTGVSISGHTHVSSNITDFNESVDDRVSNLLVGTSGIIISYNDNANTLTVAVDIIDCGEVLAPPNAPTGLSATPSNQSLALTWTAPAYVGSTPITGYTVEYTPSGGSASTVNTNSTSTSYTLTGLTNGTSYTVRVRAINSAGNGTYSSTTTGTPLSSANLTVSVSTTGSGTSSDPYLVNTNDFSVTAGVAGTLYYRTPGSCPDCNWALYVDGIFRLGSPGEYQTSSMTAGQTRNITAGNQTGQLPRYIYFVPT